MSVWNIINEKDAKEGHIHLAYITGAQLPSYQLVAKRKGVWRSEGWRGVGRREFPKRWIGTLWELPPPP
jgi:hypothetical protein